MTTTFAARRKRGERQRTLDEARTPSGRGGWRPGAGRKPTGKRIGPKHRTRAEIAPDKPIHVRLRTHPAVGRLRRRLVYHVARHALARMLGRADFRVVHVSVQHNHIHLLVEADDKRALARAMQSLCISMSRRLNKALGRKGAVILCRYEATVIKAPKQARNCLAYILNNWRRHREDWRNAVARRAAIDPYSSAPTFDGWRELSSTEARATMPPDYEPLPTARATTWLLTTGWKLHGPIRIHERPGPWNA